MEQNRIFDIIINLLIGIKSQDKLVEQTETGEILTITQCKYLLNQTIRQYQIPSDHYFVSEKALELWKQIRKDSIFNYMYRDIVTKTTETPIYVNMFHGSERKPYMSKNLERGESFIYNDIFTDEHIVTVSNIINELKNLTSYDYDTIKKVLDKIYICKVLKEEDHQIKHKVGMPTDYKHILDTEYKDAGVKVINFKDLIFENESQEPAKDIKKIKEIKKTKTHQSFNLDVVYYLKEWCKEKLKCEDLSFGHHKSGNKFIRFITPDVDTIIPYQDNLKSGYGNGHFYAYEIINYDDKFRIVFTLCNKNAQKPIRDTFNRIRTILNQKEKKHDWEWWYVFSTNTFSYTNETTAEEVYQALDNQFTQIRAQVSALLKEM